MRFDPTDEQSAILEIVPSTHRVKIEALAGTGKTSTLISIAENLRLERPRQRTLYTAFNKAVVDDVRGKITRVADARTIHSLALESLGNEFKQKLKDAPSQLEPGTQMARLGIPKNWSTDVDKIDSDGKRIGTCKVDFTWNRTLKFVKQTITNFSKSANFELNIDVVPDREYIKGPSIVDDGLIALPDEYRKQILEFASIMWGHISDPKSIRFPFLHDHYLKIWQLSNPILPFDTILFDEAQDADPIMRSVLEAQSNQLVWCGDRNQAIYGWRGAINALQDANADETLYLTKSFRFGPAIAAVANQFLDKLGSPLIQGNDDIQSLVGPIEKCDVELFRTNVMLLIRFIELSTEGKRVRISADLHGIESIIDSVLKLENNLRTVDLNFEKFRTLTDFENWLRDTDIDDDEFRITSKLIMKVRHHSSLTKLKTAIRRANSIKGGFMDNGGVFLTTPHKVKGMEFPTVKIANDFPIFNEHGTRADHLTMSSLISQENRPPSREEWHVAYVAATRASKHLMHPFDEVSFVPDTNQKRGVNTEGLTDPVNNVTRTPSRHLKKTELCELELYQPSCDYDLISEIFSLRKDAPSTIYLTGKMWYERSQNDWSLPVQISIDKRRLGYLQRKDSGIVATLLNGSEMGIDIRIDRVQNSKMGQTPFVVRIGVGWTTPTITHTNVLRGEIDLPEYGTPREVDPEYLEMVFDKFGSGFTGF